MAETAALLDDYRFVLAPTRRAKGPTGEPPSPETLRPWGHGPTLSRSLDYARI